MQKKEIKIISIVNQKGGVGKTTTSTNLAAELGQQGKKTLLIDLDPQGNSTSGVGISKKEVESSIYNVLINQKTLKEVILKTRFKNLDFVPSNVELAGAEIELIELKNRSFVLKEAVEQEKQNYDFILIDCPPSLGILTLNALTASDGVIIPLQCEYYALEGLSQLILTMKKVRELYNKNLKIAGVLLTMYDGRLKLTIQVVEEIKKFFAEKIYKTVIPKNVKLSEAPSYGEPICYYDESSKGCLAYKNLAKEVVRQSLWTKKLKRQKRVV